MSDGQELENSRSPTLGAVIRGAIRSALVDVHTALPAQVLSFDATKGTVDVQPLIQERRLQQDNTYAADQLPVLHSLPVMFPRCAGGYITFPIAANDTGLVIFCEYEIGDWVQKTVGQQVDPGGGPRHPLTGAVFYPGLWPATSTLSPPASTSDIEIISSGNVVIGGRAGAQLVALSNLVDSLISTINTWGATHVHSGVTTGPGSSGTPATGPFPGGPSSSAASKVKAL